MSAHSQITGKRILLVDDQPEVRETIRMLLELHEHQITEANDGTQALELFERETFDLVITDYAMPGMLGNELAICIKRLAPNQPILMITGSAERLGTRHNPVDAMLRKPFTMQDLTLSVSGVLTQASQSPTTESPSSDWLEITAEAPVTADLQTACS